MTLLWVKLFLCVNDWEAYYSNIMKQLVGTEQNGYSYTRKAGLNRYDENNPHLNECFICFIVFISCAVKNHRTQYFWMTYLLSRCVEIIVCLKQTKDNSTTTTTTTTTTKSTKLLWFPRTLKSVSLSLGGYQEKGPVRKSQPELGRKCSILRG